MPGREGGSYLRDPITGDLKRWDPDVDGLPTPPPSASPVEPAPETVAAAIAVDPTADVTSTDPATAETSTSRKRKDG